MKVIGLKGKKRSKKKLKMKKVGPKRVKVRVNPNQLIRYPLPGYAVCPNGCETRRLRGGRPADEFSCKKCHEPLVERESVQYMPGDVIEVLKSEVAGLTAVDKNMKGPGRSRVGMCSVVKVKKRKR